MPDRRRGWAGLPLLVLVAACTVTPSATPVATPVPTPVPTAGPSQATEPTATATPPATATPEPPLSLALPAGRDGRIVRVTVTPKVPADANGTITVEVTNLSNARIDELVLRWNTDLRQTLFLAPFKPAEARIAEGGPALYQDWTKWVNGPGESGEPAGTTSLGWGPLDAGVTLTIPIVVTRMAPGPVAFDLQVLAGEAILTLEDGSPAALRVDVPS
jgi:hypothetical protein